MKKISLIKKLIVLISICVPLALNAQQAPLKANWQNLDLATDSVFGISTEKAYKELLVNLKHVPVVVAVIDGGVDAEHEDLKSIMWSNPKEIAGNKKDDDKNGYIDDIHGWNFLGSAKGNVNNEALELTRLVRFYKAKYATADTANLKGKELATFNEYRKMRTDLNARIKASQANYDRLEKYNAMLDVMTTRLHDNNPDINAFKNYTTQNGDEDKVKELVIKRLGDYKDFTDFRARAIIAGVEHYKEELDYTLNLNFDPRGIVGDNYANSGERFYGNNDVAGPDAHHGTHVAGIIGAVRDNNLGVIGVANDVRIMSVRAVPNGDERDKDVANAIRYAAENGAKVINMSFGKDYSFDKKAVDEAVKYAMKKDVLIVHAAGNDNKNTDTTFNFPTRIYENKKDAATAWIEVGASGPKDGDALKASFSNYAKNGVDVFAPGVNIRSSTPGSTYAVFSGTSMASPVVAGLAALIRSYYPKLTALQVKEIILKSAIKVNHTVKVKQGTAVNDVPFADLSITGAIVNAYNALKLAATY